MSSLTFRNILKVTLIIVPFLICAQINVSRCVCVFYIYFFVFFLLFLRFFMCVFDLDVHLYF